MGERSRGVGDGSRGTREERLAHALCEK